MRKSIPISRKLKMQGKKKTRSRRDKRLFINHYKALHDAWSQIVETPVSSFITGIVMAITILLMTTFLVALKTLQQVTHYVTDSSQVTLYLKSGIPENEINKWISELKQERVIKEVSYISPEKGLSDLSEQGEYRNVLFNISENPLPPVILIKLNSSDKVKVQALTDTLVKSPLVSSMNIDLDWLQRLSTLVKLGSRMGYALTILFGSGVIFIISHAICESTQRNQQEMRLLHLMGASNPYIRRPFLYLGTILGVGAGLLTIFLLIILFLPLNQPLADLIESYHLTETNWLISLSVSIKILIMSTFLGWLGAWLAYYRYAKIAD